MTPKLPIVASPGSATVSAVRREEVRPGTVQRQPYAATRRDSRRASCAVQYKVFAGHTHDPRDAESLMKPETAWCEQNCQGLWTILYGPHDPHLGYVIRFGFTESTDAEAFETYRLNRRSFEATSFPHSDSH